MVTSKPVDPANIERELAALWLAQAQSEKASTRTRLLNLLVFAPDPAAGEAAQKIIGELLAREPFRAILMIADERGEGMDAWVSLTETGGEQITLTAKGPAILDLPGTVLSLLLTDVPVGLWWQSGDPFTHPIFEHLIRAVDRVIVDSLTFSDSPAVLADIAQALADSHFPAVIVDLGWSRLSPWRTLTAQIFDPPALRPHLAQIERARVTYAEGPPILAWLFGSWLASRLDWKPTHQTTDLMRFVAGQTIEFVAAPAGKDTHPGYFLGLDLLTREGATFEITRLPHACAATRIAFGETRTEHIAPVRYESLADWLGRELNRPNRTPLFEAAVQLLTRARPAPTLPQGPM
jgi:glucose-6-phosphate dehydrogenase assembly protein OpcA